MNLYGKDIFPSNSLQRFEKQTKLQLEHLPLL